MMSTRELSGEPGQAPNIFADDPFDRFRTAGGATTGKGDWAWLQHTLACLNDRGRAAVVLDTGAVTRGSGSRNEDRERNIRKWFVDHDLIDGVRAQRTQGSGPKPRHLSGPQACRHAHAVHPWLAG